MATVARGPAGTRPPKSAGRGRSRRIPRIPARRGYRRRETAQAETARAKMIPSRAGRAGPAGWAAIRGRRAQGGGDRRPRRPAGAIQSRHRRAPLPAVPGSRGPAAAPGSRRPAAVPGRQRPAAVPGRQRPTALPTTAPPTRAGAHVPTSGPPGPRRPAAAPARRAARPREPGHRSGRTPASPGKSRRKPDGRPASLTPASLTVAGSSLRPRRRRTGLPPRPGSRTSQRARPGNRTSQPARPGNRTSQPARPKNRRSQPARPKSRTSRPAQSRTRAPPSKGRRMTGGRPGSLGTAPPAHPRRRTGPPRRPRRIARRCRTMTSGTG